MKTKITGGQSFVVQDPQSNLIDSSERGLLVGWFGFSDPLTALRQYLSPSRCKEGAF